MHVKSQTPGRKFIVGGLMISLALGLGISVANAAPKQRVAVAGTHASHTTAATHVAQRNSRRSAKPAAIAYADRPYYIDFRARNAQTYGHAFVWYGRRNERKVEVAGLHPATDSWVPYMLGHIIPVPSETGASYGDLDETYLQASYRIYLTEAEAKAAFAYIKHKQANSPLWNAATYNCIMFISHIADFIGLRTPTSHLLYPEEWVKELASLNKGRKTARMAVAQ
ncbi:MAG: hypothetical protein R3D62_00865 [Xanthobacteraceae bacterium]